MDRPSQTEVENSLRDLMRAYDYCCTLYSIESKEGKLRLGFFNVGVGNARETMKKLDEYHRMVRPCACEHPALRNDGRSCNQCGGVYIHQAKP